MTATNDTTAPRPSVCWETGDALFIALAGNAWRANRVLRACRDTPEGTTVGLKRGITITGLPNRRHRVTRDGHPIPLIIEHVAMTLPGREEGTWGTRTAIIWPDSDDYT